MNVPLKNVQNTGGKYALFFMNGAGNWQRVEKIGLSVLPFQVVATFDNRPYVAVQKNGNIRNENDRRLYIINLRDGTVADGCQFGASQITFDANNKSIFFSPLASNGVPAQKYSWCLPHGGAAYMAINVPSRLQPGIQSWNTKVALVPVIEIAVIDLVPRTKRKRGRPSKKKTHDKTTQTPAPQRKRGRPLGAKNKPKIVMDVAAPAMPKRGRGRPRGSKNKPKDLTPAPVVQSAPTKPQIRKNTVSMRNTKRNSLGGLYDIYINGRRVATKRMNAHAKTFMNNRILAVSYQVPAGLRDNYDIFWPNGAQLYIDGTHRLTGMPITVNSVSENNGELKLGLSNRAVRVIREQDLSRFEAAQFILDEKQR